MFETWLFLKSGFYHWMIGDWNSEDAVFTIRLKLQIKSFGIDTSGLIFIGAFSGVFLGLSPPPSSNSGK